MFCTHVDEFGDVSGLQVVEYRGLVEIGQVGHVLATLKLRWVDLGTKNISKYKFYSTTPNYFKVLIDVIDPF